VKRVVRSFGLCLFNLLSSPSLFSNMVARSFVCVVILPLYFQLIFVNSFRSVGILRSACSSPFGTYHGALTIARSTLFWNLCNQSWFIQWTFLCIKRIVFVKYGFIFWLPEVIQGSLILSSVHVKTFSVLMMRNEITCNKFQHHTMDTNS
jgi:hypothetical protein